jgi:proton glutamate symport protein
VATILTSSFWIKLLQNPWIILASGSLGVYIGVANPELGKSLSSVGDIYLSLLKMCVLPILVSAITMSLGKLLLAKGAGRYIKKLIVVFPLSMLCVAFVAIISALIFGPGRSLSTATLQRLGVLVNSEGLDLIISLTGASSAPKESPSLFSFISSMVPTNIFGSLSDGETLKVVFFSIIFGITLGIIHRNTEKSGDEVFSVFDSVYKAFNKLIQWLTLFLPFGLFSLMSSQVAKAGLNVILAMVNFVIVGLITFFVIYLISTLVMWSKLKCSLGMLLSTLQESTILALATSNALACLPSAINTVVEKFGLDRQTVNLVIPLSVSVARFGQISYFALASLFVAQLYKTDINIAGLSVILIGSIFAGIASSGATGIATLTTISIVLQPLGLPLEAVLVLLLAIDPIMDPFRTLCTLHTSVAVTTLIADYRDVNVESGDLLATS